MTDQRHEGHEQPEPEPADEAKQSRESEPAEDAVESRGEERRAGKARRIITFAQVVVAVAQAVDAVIRLFA